MATGNYQLSMLGAVATIAAFLSYFAAAEDKNPANRRLVHQGTERDALYAIDISQNRILAAGSGTGLLSSYDSGENWKNEILTDMEFTVFGLAQAGDLTMLVGQEGAVRSRKQTSDPWFVIDTGINERLLNVDVSESGLAVVVGGFGSLAVSEDFGGSWSIIETDWQAVLDDWFEPHLYDVDVAESQITVVGEFGVVMRSSDAGKSWVVQSISDESLFAIDLRADGIGYVVGQNGFVARSEDSGVHWTPCSFDKGGNLFGVSSSDASVVAVGIRSVLLSNDACSSFVSRNGSMETSGWWQDVVYEAEKDLFYAIGSGGRILAIDGI
ncbi:MAG: YCF48-related protein [Pseudomonadota bacterium]